MDQVFDAYIYDQQSLTDEKLRSLVTGAIDEAQKLLTFANERTMVDRARMKIDALPLDESMT